MSKRNRQIKLFDRELVGTAIRQSVIKLNPVLMIKNPVMFTVELSTAVMLLVSLYQLSTGDSSQGALWYNLTIFLILLLTVLFANFAEALAEARGKAQAESLRKTREETPAKKQRNQMAALLRVVKSFPLHRSIWEIISSAPQEILSLWMAKLWKALRPLMNLPSPENLLLSFGKAEETVRL